MNLPDLQAKLRTEKTDHEQRKIDLRDASLRSIEQDQSL
jgi:hypothetical protein